jgi:hypothetical protein
MDMKFEIRSMTETREGTDVVERHYEDGDAVVQKLGFIECLEDGEPHEVKGVLLTFPVGPPDLKLSTAWDGTPFRLVPSDEIARLRSENEALKEALRPFFDGFSYDPGHSDLDNEQPISVRVQLGDWRRARRHLTARKEGQGGGA